MSESRVEVAGEDVATVSELIGDGPEAHRLVRVGEWELTAWTAWGEDEPRIRDIDLAERLGYTRNRSIRELIDALEKSGKIGEVYRRPRRGRRGFAKEIIDERWLTEEQALLVTTQSNTPKAWALTRQMIRVFMLARRGLLPGHDQSLMAEIAALRQVVTTTMATIPQIVGMAMQEVLRTVFDDRAAHSLSIAGQSGARYISSGLKRYGELMAPEGDRQEQKRWRARGETELRGFVGFTGAGRAWHDMSMPEYVKARMKIKEMLKMAERVADGRSQRPLPGVVQ